MSAALPLIDPVFSHAAAAALALVLLSAAADKLRDPALFGFALENYALLPARWLPAFSWGLPLAEGLAGLLLLPLASRTIGAGLALVVLGMVTSAVAINLSRGRTRIQCGCGGSEDQPLSPALVARNLALMALAVAAACPAAERAPVWLDYGAVALTTLALFGLYALANTLLRNHAQLTDLRNAP